MRVDVTAPSEYLGSVMGDIVKRRGQICKQEEIGNAIKIESFVPLSEMFGYVTDLRSFTQGRGTYVMQTDHYEEVPKSIAKEIIEKNGIKTKKITIITNDFHERRASEFAKQNGFKPLRYPSKTPWNGYMPFATREIFAIIYQIYLAR